MLAPLLVTVGGYIAIGVCAALAVLLLLIVGVVGTVYWFMFKKRRSYQMITTEDPWVAYNADNMAEKKKHLPRNVFEYLDTNVGSCDAEIEQNKFESDCMEAVHFYLRGSPFELVRALPPIGSRLHKMYYLVQSPKGFDYLLTMVPRPIDCGLNLLSSESIQTWNKLLPSAKHTYVYPIAKCDYVAEKDIFIIIRKCQVRGSIKDRIWKANPLSSYDRKYNKQFKGKKFNIKHVATYGRMILEAIHFLQKNGFICGHVTSSNVILEKGGTCRLAEYENDVFNVVPQLQQHFLWLREQGNRADYAVLGFGSVIYEMSTGLELTLKLLKKIIVGKSNPIVVLPRKCPPELDEVLQTIFLTTETLTVEDLFDFDLFKVDIPKIEETEVSKKMVSMVKGATKYSVIGTEVEEDLSFPKLAPVQISNKKQSQKVKSLNRIFSATDSPHDFPKPTPQSAKGKEKEPLLENGDLPTTTQKTTHKTRKEKGTKNSTKGPEKEKQSKQKEKNSKQNQTSRNDLLGSISSFSKTNLKTTETVDKSAPMLS